MTTAQFQDIHTGLLVISLQLVVILACLVILTVRRPH